MQSIERFVSKETLLSNGSGRFIDTLWRQAVEEGAEEFFTSAANNVADILIMAEKSGFMKNVYAYKADGLSDSKAMLAGQGGQRDGSLVPSPAVQSVISDMQKTLTSRSGKVSQKPNARNVGQLYTTVQMANDQANAPFNQEEVAERLMAKGFNPEKSAKMAEVIAARLNGEKLTRKQTDRLRAATDSGVVRDVMSDITKKKTDGIDSAQHNGYDEISTIGGNAVTEDLALHQDQNAPVEGGLEAIFQSGKVSVEGIKTNPSAFSGKTAEEIVVVLRNSGYDVTVKNSTRSRSGAQIIQINNPGGGKNISQVQISPGGGRHGSNPYVKISTTDQGIIKIVDGNESTYVTDGKETATIIFTGGN